MGGVGVRRWWMLEGKTLALLTPLGFASLRARRCRAALAKQPFRNAVPGDAESDYGRPRAGGAPHPPGSFPTRFLRKRGPAGPRAQRAEGERSKIGTLFPPVEPRTAQAPGATAEDPPA